MPEPESKSVEAETDQQHTFVLQGVWSRVRIRIVEWTQADAGQTDDSADQSPDALQAQPRANVPYVLVIDERSFSGQTNADGWIDHAVSPGAREGKLILEPATGRAYTLPLLLGGLDPIAAASGVCQRLANLGFCADGGLGPDAEEFQDAVRAFQVANGLETTGVVNPETRAKLQETHRS